MDNYATHKHPEAKKWLEKHPRFHRHCTPTSSSWLNLVERRFGEFAGKRIRRGVFKSEQDLIDTVMDHIEKHNANPRT